MGAQLNDALYAERQGIGGKILVSEIISLNNANFVTIDFGITPINEKSINVIDAKCNTTSTIEVMQVFKSKTEANFGVTLQLFTECFNGNFNIIAISTEPFSNGIFNLKYKIQ